MPSPKRREAIISSRPGYAQIDVWESSKELFVLLCKKHKRKYTDEFDYLVHEQLNALGVSIPEHLQRGIPNATPSEQPISHDPHDGWTVVEQVQNTAILEQLAELPVYRGKRKDGDLEVYRIGPNVEDFRAIFVGAG